MKLQIASLMVLTFVALFLPSCVTGPKGPEAGSLSKPNMGVSAEKSSSPSKDTGQPETAKKDVEQTQQEIISRQIAEGERLIAEVQRQDSSSAPNSDNPVPFPKSSFPSVPVISQETLDSMKAAEENLKIIKAFQSQPLWRGPIDATNNPDGPSTSKIAASSPPPALPKAASLPAFKTELTGSNEVRIRNPNLFAVTAGIRSADKGKDLHIPSKGVQSVYIPNGRYDIYFVYSDQADALFQGDSFTLNNNGVEIQIVQIVNGNYGIRKVK